VVRKFGDDQGGTLATSLAYSAFGAAFPRILQAGSRDFVVVGSRRVRVSLGTIGVSGG
jgi:hypothetical protein